MPLATPFIIGYLYSFAVAVNIDNIINCLPVSSSNHSETPLFFFFSFFKDCILCQTSCPDMTFAVDWALNNNYISVKPLAFSMFNLRQLLSILCSFFLYSGIETPDRNGQWYQYLITLFAIIFMRAIIIIIIIQISYIAR